MGLSLLRIVLIMLRTLGEFWKIYHATAPKTATCCCGLISTTRDRQKAILISQRIRGHSKRDWRHLGLRLCIEHAKERQIQSWSMGAGLSRLVWIENDGNLACGFGSGDAGRQAWEQKYRWEKENCGSIRGAASQAVRTAFGRIHSHEHEQGVRRCAQRTTPPSLKVIEDESQSVHEHARFLDGSHKLI